MTQTTESKFNRAKFRDNTSSDALKAADKSVENTIRTGQQNGHYAKFLELSPGLNKFLIMPSHETIKQMMTDEHIKNEPFVVPEQVYWLPREVEDKDEKGNVKKDKKGQAIMKIENKKVFDARVHSEVKKDIVDVYINIYKKQLEEEYGTGADAEAMIKDKMAIIYGRYSKNKAQNIQGVVGKPSWVVYAEKLIGDTKLFGRLSFGKAVKMGVNDVIAMEESNQPIGSESNNSLTDIENRRAVCITVNKESTTPAGFYKVVIDSDIDKDPKSPTYKQISFYPIPDSQLEEFLKFPSLSSIYKNCYTKFNFDTALAGLKLFDDKHELGIFSNQDFLDEAEHMRTLYPDPKEESTEGVVAAAVEEKGDIFDNMGREEMKAWSRTNKTGITIHSKLLDDDLRSQLKEWDKLHNSDTNASEAEEPAKEEEKSDIEKVLDQRPSAAGVKSKGSTGETAAERIARIRGANKK